MAVPVKIRFRSGTSAEWAKSDPILRRGEPGWDSTLRIMKVGTGASRWSALRTIATEKWVEDRLDEVLATLPEDPGGSVMAWGTDPPAAPSSLTGSVVNVLAPDGTQRNSVTLSSPKVTKNADGTTPTNPITSYEFRWKSAEGARNTIPTAIGPGGSPYGYLNALFDRRGRGGFGWVSGDGAISSRRSDGKDQWIFGDSMIGRLKSDGSPDPDPAIWYGIINNAMVVTNPNSITEMTSYFGRGNIMHGSMATTTGVLTDFFAVAQGALSYSTTFRGAGSTTSLRVATAGVAAHAYSGSTATPANQPLAVIPVVAGQTYTIMSTRKAGATPRSTAVFLECFNDANVSVGQALTPQVNDSVAGVNVAHVTTIPAGATKAVLRAVAYHPTGTAAGEYHYFTNFAVIPGDQRHQSWIVPRNREYDGIIRPEALAGFLPEAGRTLDDYFIWLGHGWCANGKVYVTIMLLKWATPGVAGGDYGDTGETWLAQWDEATMAFEGTKRLDSGSQTTYTDHAYTEGAYTYVVGHRTGTTGGFMMRLAAASPMTTAPTFWNGTGWGASGAASVKTIPKDSSAMHKIGSTYHAYRIDPFDRHIKEMTSTSLTSGWVDNPTSLYQMPESGADTVYTYLPRLHPQFDSPNGRVFGYSQNNSAWSAVDGTPRFAIGPPGPLTAPNFSGVPWAGKDYANSPATIVSQVPSGAYFYAESRAVDQSGNASTDSSGATERWTPLSSPIYVPPVSSTPATPNSPLVFARFEDAEISVDGLTTAGAEYDSSTTIEVHFSRQNDFVPSSRTLIETLPSTGGRVFVQVPSKSNRYTRLVAVSAEGARSAPSVVVPISSPDYFTVGINRRINFANPGDENFHYMRFAPASEWGFFPYDHIQIASSDALVFKIFDGEQMTMVKEQGINAKVPLNMGGRVINLNNPGDNSSVRYVGKAEWGFFPYDHNYYVAPEGHRWGITGKDVLTINPNVMQMAWLPFGLTQVTTAGRPSGGGLQPGAMLYDTTIQSIIVWNGAEWLTSGGSGGGSSAWADITGKPTTFAPTIGTTATTAKAGDYAPTWAEVTGKPTTFTPAAHTHTIANVTSLQSTLDAKAATSHTHGAADLTGVVKTINNTAPDANGNVEVAGGSGGGATAWADITGKPTTFPPAVHTHAAADISDATTVGRNVLKAVDAAAARTAIGASSLAIGTTGTTAAAGNHTHTAANITDSTTVGRAVMTAATAAAARTAIGAADATAVGGTDTDYVATFESRLA